MLIYKGKQSTFANKEGKKTWHISLMKSGKVVDTQGLAAKIAEKSSLTPGDVHNAVRNLLSVIREELLNGHSVRLDGLGTLTIYARTRKRGVEKKEDVNPNQITALNFKFTPEYTRPASLGTTRAITEGVEFIHIDHYLKKMKEDSGGGFNPSE